MHYILFLVLSLFSLVTHSQNNDTWFQYHSDKDTYTIDATNIQPAAFFKKLSLSSGIEIQFDASIVKPISFYGKQVPQDAIFRFLEKEFSTLTKYKKNKRNEDVLTSLAVLPKGQFQSNKMIVAVDPVTEAVNDKKGTMNKKAIPAYATRFHHLKEKVKHSTDKSAENQINHEERREQRIAEKRARREERMKQKQRELQALKEKDPALYEMQKQRWGDFQNNSQK
ncbi:hypothetical protein NBRC116188_21740 [Oceaniserpentilla sp. 4NH20-0058]|uniref:hypothetical protein n=1 Tax=Oceaniserpentilla sp. 4NH20-0058 TaxID=3127660 RepID=UPI0031062C5F